MFLFTNILNWFSTMNITIKPYSQDYDKQCADLEQYLWKEDEKGREIRFDWAYTHCPVHEKPLCVIAVNEDEELVGFRGYFLNKYKIGNEEFLVAQLSDTVVSDKARRQGIFQKMTNFSLDYLKDSGVSLIINLSPSWPPYYGYKKISFEDLSQFHSKYKFGFGSILSEKSFRKKRSWKERKETVVSMKGITYHIASSIDQSVIAQVEQLVSTSHIHSSLSIDILKWRTSRPGKDYLYAYTMDASDKLYSFMILSTVDYYNYNLGLFLSDHPETFKLLFRLFRKEYKPSTIAAWDFAMDDSSRKLLNKVGMVSIPFINKIRKNPPALVRTLQTNEDGSLNWNIGGVDIRKVENWTINKFDLDSF